MSILINHHQDLEKVLSSVVRLHIYIYIYMCVCVCVCVCVYIYIYTERETENKVIQSEEFNVKESRRYNMSILINHYQDLEKMLSSVVSLQKNVYIYIYIYVCVCVCVCV